LPTCGARRRGSRGFPRGGDFWGDFCVSQHCKLRLPSIASPTRSEPERSERGTLAGSRSSRAPVEGPRVLFEELVQRRRGLPLRTARLVPPPSQRKCVTAHGFSLPPRALQACQATAAGVRNMLRAPLPSAGAILRLFPTWIAIYTGLREKHTTIVQVRVPGGAPCPCEREGGTVVALTHSILASGSLRGRARGAWSRRGIEGEGRGREWKIYLIASKNRREGSCQTSRLRLRLSPHPLLLRAVFFPGAPSLNTAVASSITRHVA